MRVVCAYRSVVIVRICPIRVLELTAPICLVAVSFELEALASCFPRTNFRWGKSWSFREHRFYQHFRSQRGHRFHSLFVAPICSSSSSLELKLAASPLE